MKTFSNYTHSSPIEHLLYFEGVKYEGAIKPNPRDALFYSSCETNACSNVSLLKEASWYETLNAREALHHKWAVSLKARPALRQSGLAKV